MECLCGKNMIWMGRVMPGCTEVAQDEAPDIVIVLWACPPEGCGRIYLQGSGCEIDGTWYTPESNEVKDQFD